MINAHDIEMMRSEMRKVAADVVSETMASNQPESRSENSFESKPTEIWLDPPKPNITEYLPPPHPFEIVVELDPETSVPTVYVRNGAFVLNEPDGTHKFVATNELTSEAAYTLYEVPNEREADKTIWAKLDMSDTEPVATIVTTKPTDDPDVFYVCIGKVNAEGGIEQYVFGHIPYGGAVDIRGDRALFKAVTDRAYLKADDTLVDEDVAYNESTMYLYPTWDWIRWP
jgi:hypothetical protein